MNTVEDRLQHAGRAVVRLHRVGEHEVGSAKRDPIDFVQHAATIATMQDCVL